MLSNTMNGSEKLCFEDIVLHKSHKVSYRPIDRGYFYISPRKSIEKRLMREADLCLSNCVGVVYCEILPDSVLQSDLTCEECDVRHLCSRHRVHEETSCRVFRECITNKSLPSALKPLQGCIGFVPVLSQACGSGFSQKNLIATPNNLLTDTVSDFLLEWSGESDPTNHDVATLTKRQVLGYVCGI